MILLLKTSDYKHWQSLNADTITIHSNHFKSSGHCREPYGSADSHLKYVRDNTHYNLGISLSVCDFIFGLILIMYGTVLMPNNDSNEEIPNLSSTILNTVSGGTYQMSIVHCQTIFISFNRYLVITEKR